jgi:hypothetical protein
MALEDSIPDQGQITVRWHVTVIDGRRRLGWRYSSEPRIDPADALVLLRDVADELELGVPEES